jgi:hypothetical protein
MSVSDEMMSDRVRDGGRRHAEPTPRELGKGKKKKERTDHFYHYIV